MPHASGATPTRTIRSAAGTSRVTKVAAAVAALVTFVGLGACSSGPVEQTGAGTVVEITASDNVFEPETIEVKPGTQVVWTNEGRNNHDILPVAANGNWGVKLAEFGSDTVYSHTFTEPGTFEYYCTVHGTKTRGMIGKIVVTE